MSRKGHHSEASSLLTVAAISAAAGGVFMYKDRLIFAVGAALVIGLFIGFWTRSRQGQGQGQRYYEDQPPSQRIKQPRAQPAIQRAQRNGWEPPALSNKMILLSPECMGREACAMCPGTNCQCPCKHDPASITAWNAAHYDAAMAEAGDDEEMPF